MTGTGNVSSSPYRLHGRHVKVIVIGIVIVIVIVKVIIIVIVIIHIIIINIIGCNISYGHMSKKVCIYPPQR